MPQISCQRIYKTAFAGADMDLCWRWKEYQQAVGQDVVLAAATISDTGNLYPFSTFGTTMTIVRQINISPADGWSGGRVDIRVFRYSEGPTLLLSSYTFATAMDTYQWNGNLALESLDFLQIDFRYNPYTMWISGTVLGAAANVSALISTPAKLPQELQLQATASHSEHRSAPD